MLLVHRGAASASSREQAERFERIVRGERLGAVRTRRDLRGSLIEFGASRVDQATTRSPRCWRAPATAGTRRSRCSRRCASCAPTRRDGAVRGAWTFAGLRDRRRIRPGLLCVVHDRLPAAEDGAAHARRRAHDDACATTSPRSRTSCACSTSAGSRTEQSLHVFAKEQRGVLPDIALEIGEVTRRVSAGSDLGEATRSVAEEAGDPELSDLFAMIRQIDRYGGAVQEPLMRFAAAARGPRAHAPPGGDRQAVGQAHGGDGAVPAAGAAHLRRRTRLRRRDPRAEQVQCLRFTSHRCAAFVLFAVLSRHRLRDRARTRAAHRPLAEEPASPPDAEAAPPRADREDARGRACPRRARPPRRAPPEAAAVPGARLLRAEALRRTGQIDAAWKVYEPLLMTEAAAPAWRGLALIKADQGDLATSVAGCAARATSSRPSRGSATTSAMRCSCAASWRRRSSSW